MEAIDGLKMNRIKTDTEGEASANGAISSSAPSGFTTVDLHEPAEGVKLTGENQEQGCVRGERKESKKFRSSLSKNTLDQEALIENDSHSRTVENEPCSAFAPTHPLDSTNSGQELPSPCDLSPTAHLRDSSNNPLDNIQVVVSPHGLQPPQHPPLGLKPPSVSASIFAFIMTVAFVCVLWLVVFMVFGYRGHAIAGVFVGLFLVGLLLNTCFLKLYFRLKVFLGVNANIAAAERHAAAVQRHRQIQEQLALQKANEKPPPYEKVMASPPPYNLLQYYRQKKSTTSLSSSASRASFYLKGHKCPFCRKDVKVFGICPPCKNRLSAK